MFVFRFLKKDGIGTVHWSNQVIEFVNLLQFKKKLNCKSQNLSDFLQTMGYARKKIQSKILENLWQSLVEHARGCISAPVISASYVKMAAFSCFNYVI